MNSRPNISELPWTNLLRLYAEDLEDGRSFLREDREEIEHRLAHWPVTPQRRSSFRVDLDIVLDTHLTKNGIVP